jgi:sugar O-acyltransferase (sialic acid O-acetyltransferase NeuD family)
MGTGGHASVVADLARSAGFDVLGCLGPQAPSAAIGMRYLGPDTQLDSLELGTVAAIGAGSVGELSLRRRLFEALMTRRFDVPVLVHSSAVIAPGVELECGSQVMAGTIVQPHAQIGANVILNTRAIVEHHTCVGDHVHIAPGAVVCGGVTIGSSSHVGANATVLQGLRIGTGAVIGAGAVVTRSVADGAVVKGNPAK